jgi:hypothetical protein
MTALYGAFTDARGNPCQGVVGLTPRQLRSSVIEGDSLLGSSRVLIVLDEHGEFSEDIDPGDYRADIRLANAEPVSRDITIPWAEEVDIRGLLDEYEPTPSEATAQFGQGLYTYGIPWWAKYLDVVLLGGGGGGDDGITLVSGEGGHAGEWVTATLERGVDIPWESSTITGYVGAGGAHNEGNGEDTTAVSPGMTLLTAPGGAGGGSGSADGLSPGNQSLNGKTYVGGGEVSTLGEDGEAPGGAGAGGPALNGDGGAGAAGAAWFRAYR